MQRDTQELSGHSKPHYKYYRNKPIADIDLYKTLYANVVSLNQDNLDSDAIGFLGKNITYRQLFKNVDRLADAYAKIGIEEGDTVAICTINMPIVQENLLALSKLGATSKWIDLRIKGKDLIKNINESNCKVVVIFEGILSAIQEIIDETNVTKVIVASPKDYLSPIFRMIAGVKDKKEGKAVKFPLDKRYVKYTKFIKTGSVNSTVVPVEFKKDRPSIIVQSSGSTGTAKSIIHTEYNFNSLMLKEAYTDLPFCKGKSVHIAIPPFIIYGLNGSLYVCLVFGMKAQMTPFVSETTMFEDLGKYEAAGAAPLHYRYLYNKITELQDRIFKLKNSDNKKALSKAKKELDTIMSKLSKTDVFVTGGDKITSEELLRMEHAFGTSIVNAYGNNEVAGGAIISPVYASKPDSVGIPMRGITVAAFDPDTQERLENGVEGEICINSDNVFVGYLNNEEETRKIKQLHADGTEWIHTGDLGYIDADGYVYINGRSKRLIKREAFKISPDSIENIINMVKEVNDCVVVGVPDANKEGSFVPMAYVELYPEFKDRFEEMKKKIEQLCKEELPDYEIPAYILSIDKIPYKNNKHAFKELEKMGEEYVKKL